MTYVRTAYDRRPTQALFARSRDPDVPLTVQRNIDETFRALNGLRILTGARSDALGRAIGLTSRGGLPRPRAQGAPEPLQRVSQSGSIVKLREETYEFPPTAAVEVGSPFFPSGYQVSGSVQLPNVWAISYATVRLGDINGSPSPILGARIEIVLFKAGGNVGFTGGLVLATRTIDMVQGREYHLTKAMFKGQDAGGLRDISPHSRVFARIVLPGTQVFTDHPGMSARVTGLVDERIGLP